MMGSRARQLLRIAWLPSVAIAVSWCAIETHGQNGPSAADREERAKLADRGKLIFEATCTVCHGYDGEGQGELGFKLTSPEAAGWTDEQIAKKIYDGNLPKGMPPFGAEHLKRGALRDFGMVAEPFDINAVVAYLRVLQREAAERRERLEGESDLPGDPVRGEALFRGKARCAECHVIAGRGGAFGPDLTRLADRMITKEIRVAITRPSKDVARAYRMKELNLGRGNKVAGVYRAESSSAIELYDGKRKAWIAYEKAQIKFSRPIRNSPMPSGLIEGLSRQEAADLIAFLSLKRPPAVGAKPD